MRPIGTKLPDALKPAKSRPQAPDTWSEITPYAVLSLGSFLCALILVGLLLWKADTLVALGLTGSFYYILLLPLGLSVAGFLFGALRSFARYRGKHFGGVLELGGPVVGFALVVIGGFQLPPPTTNFPLTIYVHGGAGPHEMVLKGSGFVLLDLGGERRREPIGDKGQAFFHEVPASFRGQQVHIALEAAGYTLAEPGRKVRLDGASIYLLVRRTSVRIAGRVQDEEGKPVIGASLTVAGLAVVTDAAGRFDLVIPGDRLQPELSLQVHANGYAPWKSTVVPNANEVTIILRRKL